VNDRVRDLQPWVGNRAIWLVLAGILFITSHGRAQQTSPTAASGTEAKHPYNIILVLSDQQQFDLLAKNGFQLPARDRLMRQGVTFENHYIASAMCTPSRAALLSGEPPQVNGVFDQMQTGYVPSLKTDQPNMGNVMKKLGYQTAFFGKFEMDFNILNAKDTVNYSTALQPYGFDTFAPDGEKFGRPDQGYKTDFYTAGEGVRWLRAHALESRDKGQPFFLVVSFVNPHDIMYGDANLPGKPVVQKASVDGALTSPPDNELYRRQWDFSLSPSLDEPVKGPGMPAALMEYYTGWSNSLGYIPTARTDMWRNFYNYYLNLIRDNDSDLQHVLDAMDELGLWKDTIVIFTADHGEMGGAHGGQRGKGPFSYEENSHVPMIIVHPDYAGGKTTQALTSHLDLLPTIAGLTGLPEAQRDAATKGLPGHDFSAVLAHPENADLHAVRPGVLFNYVGPLTVDVDYCDAAMKELLQGKLTPSLAQLKPRLYKRGFLTFAFDGRYKFTRYYSPDAFNTPQTLQQIMQNNDVQLFDLKSDPQEMHNLALEPEKYKDTLLRMNALLNDLMAKEVGVNDGSFLPQIIRPKSAVSLGKQ
jgi:arylsulfatase